MSNLKIRHSLLLLIPMLITSCKHYKTINSNTYKISTVDNNVCKKLVGNVVMYAIFVDTRYTQPWSEYDISSTLDSINRAKIWLERKAFESGVILNIEIKYHQNGKKIPLVNNFQDKTLSGTLFSPIPKIGVPKIDRWSDRIARTAGLSLPKDTSKIIKTLNRVSDRERLIARLRDISKTDNVALIYFINDYYSEDMSVALHTSSSISTEYAVVSFKRPAVIAHEFLHLFGALDLYKTPFERKKEDVKRKNEIMKLFPTEIMAFAYRRIDSLSISPLTKYLIGWDNELDEKVRQKVLGNIKVLKY